MPRPLHCQLQDVPIEKKLTCMKIFRRALWRVLELFRKYGAAVSYIVRSRQYQCQPPFLLAEHPPRQAWVAIGATVASRDTRLQAHA